MNKKELIKHLESLIAIEKAEMDHWSHRANPQWTQHDIAQNRHEAFTEALELVKKLEATNEA